MILGFNGGLLGSSRVSTKTSASGLWFPNEQSIAQRTSSWPGLNDPLFSSVVLLLQFDTTSGLITDSSPLKRTITSVGTPLIDNNVFKYGTGSLKLDGSSGLSWSGATLSGNYTVECFFNADDITRDSIIFGATTNTDFLLRFNYLGGTGKLSSFSYAGDWIFNGSSSNLSGIGSSTFYHIAQTRSGSVIRDFVNGNLIQTNSNFSTSIFLNQIGGRGNPIGSTWKGYLDEIRITTACRYTASFTPPPTFFPNY